MRLNIEKLILCLAIFSFGCNKHKDWTTVNFHLYNPVTNEPYSDIEFQIVLNEKVNKFGFKHDQQVEVVWTGKTDAQGKVSHSFRAKKNDKYFYIVSFPKFKENPYPHDKYVAVNDNYLDYSLDYGGQLAVLKNEVNNKIFRYVEKVSLVYHVKNINCLNANDHIRFRYKSIYKTYWSSWNPIYDFPNSYGCIDYASLKRPSTQDIYEIEMEVTRNNSMTIIRDTAYILGQKEVDTVKIYY